MKKWLIWAETNGWHGIRGFPSATHRSLRAALAEAAHLQCGADLCGDGWTYTVVEVAA